MIKAIYPIKEEFVNRIFQGTKAYEYRKSLCKEEVTTIVIYESRGRGVVVGEFEITERLCDTPNNLWERTKDFSGISKESFDAYFKGCDKAYAYGIGNVNIFIKPKTLEDYGITKAPQNYIYTDL
jgi:predicted transcriptional regulator